MDKSVIRDNFSRYAKHYDRYSTVQDTSASSLIDFIESDRLNRILDIGCGTGTYTKLLLKRFPGADITAVDISEDMIAIAKEKLNQKQVRFIVSDGETLNLREKFDLITSNACFQWFGNLGGTLENYRKWLSPNGIILFSMFGQRTFFELRDSLKDISKEGSSISTDRFMSKVRVGDLLKKVFRKVEIKEKTLIETYNSLAQLLRKIKYTGTTGNGTSIKGIWTPDRLHKLEAAYIRKFGHIRATYQAIFCRMGR